MTIDIKGNIILERKGTDALLFQPDAVQRYVVAWDYDEPTGSWASGSYYSDPAAAYRYLCGYDTAMQEALVEEIRFQIDEDTPVWPMGFDPFAEDAFDDLDLTGLAIDLIVESSMWPVLNDDICKALHQFAEEKISAVAKADTLAERVAEAAVAAEDLNTHDAAANARAER
jgi:hypothetical protein